MSRMFLLSDDSQTRSWVRALEFRLAALVVVVVAISSVGPVAGRVSVLYGTIETAVANIGLN